MKDLDTVKRTLDLTLNKGEPLIQVRKAYRSQICTSGRSLWCLWKEGLARMGTL